MCPPRSHKKWVSLEQVATPAGIAIERGQQFKPDPTWIGFGDRAIGAVVDEYGQSSSICLLGLEPLVVAQLKADNADARAMPIVSEHGLRR